jgi:hypothetical protein
VTLLLTIFQTLAAFGAAFYLSWELTVRAIASAPITPTLSIPSSDCSLGHCPVHWIGWMVHDRLEMNSFSNSHISDAITAAQNESLDQYSAAGGIATEALNAIRTVSALNAQPLFLSK